jgi:hypothetical protein
MGKVEVIGLQLPPYFTCKVLNIPANAGRIDSDCHWALCPRPYRRTQYDSGDALDLQPRF